MDTQEKREKEEQGKQALHPSVQVRLGKEDLFFGPGKAWLMECIEETGSMQEACTKMGLSYSKAAKMMKKAEKQLGFKLLERRIGGSGGGGSKLTEEGRELLKKYRELTRRVQEDADRVFAEVFGTEL
jgi:molybdate transport system regulatory protein